MKINWAKIISLIGNVASLFFAIRWFIKTEYDYEPLITAIGLVSAIILQLFFWRNKNIFHYELSNKAGDMAVEGSLSFAQYDYQITLKPKAKNNYWRLGIKLSKQYNISLDRLSHDNPLLHLTQTHPHILSVHYYDENNVQWQKAEHPVDNNYNFDELQILINSDLHSLTIKIVKRGKTLFTNQYDIKYAFGKILAWADGNDYKISCKVKRLPKGFD